MTSGPERSNQTDPQDDQNTPRKEGFRMVNPLDLLLKLRLQKRQRKIQGDQDKERKVNE